MSYHIPRYSILILVTRLKHGRRERDLLCLHRITSQYERGDDFNLLSYQLIQIISVKSLVDRPPMQPSCSPAQLYQCSFGQKRFPEGFSRIMCLLIASVVDSHTLLYQ